MKNSIASAIVACLLSLVAVHSAQGQECPPDRPECVGVQWTTYDQQFVLSTGCIVQVAYAVRLCGGSICEIRLDGITSLYTYDGCFPCDPLAMGTSLEQITEEVLRHLLSRNRGTVQCNDMNGRLIHIVRPMCWSHYVILGRRTYEPCGGCCIIQALITTQNGQTTIGPPVLDPNFTPNPIVCPPTMPPGCAVQLHCPDGPGGNWLYGIPTP